MKHCVAVFGPGRSGTSLTMKLLTEVGLQLSPDLVPASDANPDGHFEDVQIRNLQQRLMRSLSLSPYLPRPTNWMDSPTYGETVRALTDLVTATDRRHDGIWGFKDPRTCVLWPMWQDVWSATGVEARPVFCVRNGAAVIASMVATYGLARDAAEGIYLYRVYHSLRDVAEGWFFVQYPDWRRQPERQLRDLAAYCGLTDDVDYGDVVARVYRPELQRHSDDGSSDVSGVVAEADELLAECTGTLYDRARIDAWCASVEHRMADFAFVFSGVGRLTGGSQQARPPWQRLVRRSLGRLRR